ncbi:hypothetical protein [Paenibacillus sp. BC26]|uniref:hypothetical protein n=1 Tax=Paenibacillus sp. BC26 TaxID=1881032 RepID=UPI0008E25692|nr:hypothetical protein [Paenibacillus sp. BC26]SFS77790.1 hypothetical protein SAMN05428962_2806 [Paenibacillus sp. BC26]
MYRRIAISLLIFCTFLFGTAMECTYAIPTSTSEHWSVSLGKPILDEPNIAKPIPNVSNMYSLNIKNNGDKAYNVRVQVFRDEPDSQTQLQLFDTHSAMTGVWSNGEEYKLHKNLPVSVKANDIEIVLYWETEADQSKIVKENNAARTWKQSFHFKQKDLH